MEQDVGVHGGRMEQGFKRYGAGWSRVRGMWSWVMKDRGKGRSSVFEGVHGAGWTGFQGNKATGCAHVRDEGHGVQLMSLRVLMARCSKALVIGGCPQWLGVKTACGTWTETGHGTLASTANSSPSAAAHATSGTAVETLCAGSPSATSATALPSGATARADGAGGCPERDWVFGTSTRCW